MERAYPAAYSFDNTKCVLTPCVDTHVAWDADQNNCNNKTVPAVGAKLRRPIDKGDLFVGVKYEVDYRRVNDTVDTGSMIFAVWYNG